MTNTYQTQAIIIKRINLGESDRIVTAVSQKFGKIRFIAKGIRKINSKHSGCLELLYKTNLLLVKGKSLDILSGAEIVKTYLPSDADLEQIKTASLFAEIIDSVVPDGEPDYNIFSMLEESLELITWSSLARLYFETSFYNHSGIFPHIDTCVRCQSDKVRYFSFQASGALCDQCRHYFSDSAPTSAGVLKFWSNFKKNGISDKIPTDISQISDALKISDRYLKNLTTHHFKSIEI